VNVSTGSINTVVGDFNLGYSYSGDGGPAISAGLSLPTGVNFDAAGNLYVIDAGNNVVRRVAASTGIITTVAGNGNWGFGGDGGPATNAALNLISNFAYPDAGVAVDAGGNLYIPDTYNSRIRRVDGVTDMIATIAGGGSGGDSGPATSATLDAPAGVAVDASGNLFTTSYGGRVRRVDSATGLITTVAGNGISSFSGDGGPATSAALLTPLGMAMDANGNLFIADVWNNRIRRVDAVSGLITTVAGGGCGQTAMGDGGPATSACVHQPRDVAVDSAGDLFITDIPRNVIRRVDVVSGIITTVAGNGTAGYSGDGGAATSAELNDPRGVQVDSAGNLFISDTGNNVIRRVDATTGIISTFAGTGTAAYGGDGGPASSAQLNAPRGLAIDHAGNLFIGDCYNSRIRRVDVATGIITTVAGNGTLGFAGDGGPAGAAALNNPFYVALDNSGHLFIGDAANNRVREVLLPPFVGAAPTSLTFASQAVGASSIIRTVILTNTGGGTLVVSKIAMSGDFTETDSCGAGVAAGATCTISVTFTPTALGTRTGTITLMDNAAGGPQQILLSGTGISPVATSTGSVSFGPITVGQTSGSQTVTVTNNGSSSIAINGISTSGGFSETNNCGTSLAAGASCTIMVTSDPTSPGATSGTLTINDSDPTGPHSVALQGIGLAPGDIVTVAGGGPNSPAALAAQIAWPASAAIDRLGNLYVAAAGADEVLKIDASGNLSVVAGTGYAGYSGDGGPATSAALNFGGIYVGTTPAIALDAHGNLFISDTVNSAIRRVDAATGIITTVAGNGTAGYSGDSGPATNAQLNFPGGIALDSSGNLYIADGSDVIRRVDATTGIITTFAGTYSTVGGYSGDGGPAISALLGFPYSVAVDSSGNLFIVDTNNCVIREVKVSTGIITTVVGDATQGGNYSGDGGPAISAGLAYPTGVNFDAAGNMFIVDSYNDVVRRVAVSTGIITTVAGNGNMGFSGDGGPATSATLNLATNLGVPITGIAVDAGGNLFIPDTFNNRIRRVDGTTAIITTVAGGGSGGDGGPATSATLFSPSGLVVDSSGNFWTADDTGRVRRVDGATGLITTVAGNGTNGFSGDGGPATSAALLTPLGVARDAAGNLFIADGLNNRIRGVNAATGIITTVAGGGSCKNGIGDGGPATSACLRQPRDVAADSAGNLFVADTGTNVIRRVDATTGIITTVAGNATAGYSGDGGPATSAQLSGPRGVSVDSAGNLFIADSVNSVVRRVDTVSGIITTVAGNGTPGYSGDGGPATRAQLSGLRRVAVDTAGNLFIGDSMNSVVRRVDAASGIITTVAGNGTFTFSGDGGPATAAALDLPFGVALDNSGHLFIGDLANNRVREVLLPPFLGLSPTSLNFANQYVGVTSNAQTVTLTNTGAALLNIFSITASGDFTETNTCGASLAPGANCTVSVTFTPTATGTRNGSLLVSDNAAGSPQSVALTGTGAAPTAVVSPGSLTFGNQNLGTTSAPQTVTLSNTGTATLTVSGIVTSGDFAQTNNCGGSVAAGGSCTINVTFAPTATGTRTGSLTITDNANNSPQVVSLTGSAINAMAGISPAARSFGDQVLGTASTAKTVTLTSSGTTNLNISGMTFTGTNTSDFAETNNCPASMAPGVKCTISVTFTPSQTGAETAALTIADNAANSPQSVALSGTGVVPVALSPISLSFGKQAENVPSPAKTITLTNNLDYPLAISSITTSGNFAQTNNCGTSVPANSKCTISVTFTPSIIGGETGDLTVTDSASTSPQTASLSGTGVVPATLSPISLSFGNQPQSTTSAAKNVTLTNNLDSALAITITTSGDFAQTGDCGSSVPADGKCTISVTFTPSSIGGETGTLTVTDSASNSPQTAALSGTGIVQAKVAPISLTFAKQPVGSPSAGKNVTLTNNLATALPISITFTGANAGDFAETDTCSGSVAAGSQCTITVTFTPTAAGTRTATLNVNDSANNSPQTVALTGTGK